MHVANTETTHCAKRRLSIRVVLGFSLAVIVIAFGGQATYMTAKAELAQVLLTRAWNQGKLSREATVPWPWADTYPVALLAVPALSLEQVVLDSHSGEAMAFGPGMITVDGSYVLGGHRDSHFAFLQRLQVGDSLNLNHLSGESDRYRISDIFVVDTRKSAEYVPPIDSLTLITCYPFDAISAGGPLRYVVVGETAVKEV